MKDIETLLRETAEEEEEATHQDGKQTLAEAAAQVQREEEQQQLAPRPEDDDNDGYGSDSFEAGSPKPRPAASASSDSSSSEESSPELSDVDVQLQICCFRGDSGGVEKILSKGSGNGALSRRDQHGWTPLHWCASKGHSETMRMILEHAAPKPRRLVNSQDDVVGWTPLHVC